MSRACARCGSPGHYSKTCMRDVSSWREYMLATGRCRTCGRVREASSVFCEEHRLKANAVARAKRAAVKEAMGLAPDERKPNKPHQCSICLQHGHNARTRTVARVEV